MKLENHIDKDALKTKNIDKQIFQIDLELSQTADPDERKKLEALRAIYVKRFRENKRRRFMKRLLLAPLIFLALIALYFFLSFNRDTADSQKSWAQSGSTVSEAVSSNSSSSAASASSKAQASDRLPAELIGTWTTGDYGGVILTISKDGIITKTQDNYVMSEEIIRYEELAPNVYRFYPASGSELASSLIFSGIGGTGTAGHPLRYATGIYINGDTVYPQLWSTIEEDFTYTVKTDIKMTRGQKKTASSYVDTTDLEKEQVQYWVLSVFASQNRLSNAQKNDYFVNVKLYDDQLVYASVRKKSAADERIALYRVNADGYLEQGTLEATDWAVVSTTYSE